MHRIRASILRKRGTRETANGGDQTLHCAPRVAAATESMEEQARNLAQAVAIFKLTGITAGGAGQAFERSENPSNVARLAMRENARMRRPLARVVAGVHKA